MSQYPPPPPSYGAYDQPPPPGFGYPPGNQGPYYPQPGYPQPPYQPGGNPTTCPPGPGGYYPGQPATQTIEKEDESDFFLKGKETLNEKTNFSLAEAKKYNDKRITPLHKSANYKPTIRTNEGEMYKSFATKQHDEARKSTTLNCGKNSQKQFSTEGIGEEHEKLSREESHSYVESTVLEPEKDYFKNSTVKTDTDNCKAIDPDHIELRLSSVEMESEIISSENSEFSDDENVGGKCQRRKRHRLIEKNLAKNNEMHRLLDQHRDPIHRPQFVLINNKQSENFGNPSNKSTSNENDESGKTEDCNDEFCSGDCGKDDCYRDRCEEDCCNDDCQTNEEENSYAIADPGYRKYLPPRVLNNKCQPESFKMSSYRVITSQPKSNNWNDSDLVDRYKEECSKAQKTGSHEATVELVYRNYLPQKVLNNNVQPANLKCNTQRVITAEPVPHNRHGKCDCGESNCCGDNCCESYCCQDGGYADECCKEGCCKQGCCKQGCCKDSCCHDCSCKDSCCDNDLCKTDICVDCCSDVCKCCCDCIGQCLMGFCECAGDCDCDCDD